jgi:putative colanic acid biosynthesis UDP-glucose lipid carrier transferase
MPEPVLLRNSFTIAFVTVLQAILPPVVALASLFLIGKLLGGLDPTSTAVVIIATLALTLIQKPPDLNEQLTITFMPAVVNVVIRWLLLLFMFLVVGYATRSLEGLDSRVFLTWAGVTPVVLVVATLLMQVWMRHLLLVSSPPRKAVVVGLTETSRELARRLATPGKSRIELEGFFDDRSDERLRLGADDKLIGRLDEMAAFVQEHRIDVIFIALPIRHLKRVMILLDQLHDTTASIYYVPDVHVFDLIQSRSTEIHKIPVVALCETPFYGYRGLIKRVTDMTISAGALLALSPLLLVVALMVKLTSKGPVIFKQRRYGLDGHEISVYKFRSMKVMDDGAHVKQASKDDPRLTPIGGFLRKSSIDELPQLINVLQGRMSLVGPRPHAVAHNEEYRKLIKGYMIRHKVMPGITGLAQVNGCRGETAKLEDMEARIKYDLEYLRRWTPMLDFQIMWQTAMKLLRDDKAY